MSMSSSKAGADEFDAFDEFDEDDRFRQHCMTEESEDKVLEESEEHLKVLDFDECDEEARLAVHNATIESVHNDTTIESEPTNSDVVKTDSSQESDVRSSGRPAIYFGPPEETPAEAEASRSAAVMRSSRLAWSDSKAPPEESRPEEIRPPPARPEPRLDPYARAMAAGQDHKKHAKAVARAPQPAAPPPPPPSAFAKVGAEPGADAAAAATAPEEEPVAARRGGARRLPGSSPSSYPNPNPNPCPSPSPSPNPNPTVSLMLTARAIGVQQRALGCRGLGLGLGLGGTRGCGVA